MKRNVGGPKVQGRRAVTLSQDLETVESGQPDAADLPSAPGPGATPEEWRAWGEAMYKAGKLGAHTSRDG